MGPNTANAASKLVSRLIQQSHAESSQGPQSRAALGIKMLRSGTRSLEAPIADPQWSYLTPERKLQVQESHAAGSPVLRIERLSDDILLTINRFDRDSNKEWRVERFKFSEDQATVLECRVIDIFKKYEEVVKMTAYK
ncbi:MAG: hypothetical protein Q9208_002431, partial [Pyrenodesmia sp. 3 TL-2023]